ncbi:MAG: hypothetical protein ACTSQY_05270 [Candidatus Odinarchaeia archaeon]
MASNDDRHLFEVGDMCAFRDVLEEDGFEWGGVDFYVQKVGKGR